jgi:hypothetical protein
MDIGKFHQKRNTNLPCSRMKAPIAKAAIGRGIAAIDTAAYKFG